MLNVGLSMEMAQLDTTGAEGIGLYRTEIGMLARGSIADVAEQAASYARVLDAAAGRPVMFRTLDLGADKLLPGDAPEEENPAMGWRSLRIGLDRPALLRRQLRALLLAAAGRPLSVMFPMVATVAEFRAARALLLAEARRVRPAPERLDIGTMLEIPALMWQLDELLREVDFVSVGSNDLLQFLFAADRGTPALVRPLRSAVAARAEPARTVWWQRRVRPRVARGAGIAVRRGGVAATGGDGPGRAGLGTLSMPASGIMPVKALAGRARPRRVSPCVDGNPSQCRRCREPARADQRCGRVSMGLAV